ncbi:hemolysin III family protein, partial [Mesorhizobium sp. B2-7-1]
IGWSGGVRAGPLGETLPTTSVALLIAGGIVYSLGVIFFAWKGLRFHNAVWHGFVVTGAGLHLAAMVDCLVVNRF